MILKVLVGRNTSALNPSTLGASKMAQRVKVLVAKPDSLCWIHPGAHLKMEGEARFHREGS